MDISNWIARRADWSPDKVVIHFEGIDISYAALEDRIARLAGALRDELNVEAGDRIAHLGYNAPELVELVFACARIGSVVVPLNWRLTVSEHQFMVSNCAPKAIFAEPDFHDHVGQLAEQEPDIRLIAYGDLPDDQRAWVAYDTLIVDATGLKPDYGRDLGSPQMIVYTSGTTGRPKGAVLTQEALFYGAVNSMAAFDMTSADHVLTVIPMFHVGGMNIQTLPAIYAGATVTLHPRFDPEKTLADLAARKPTLFIGVPAIAQALAVHPRFAKTDLSSLRCLCTGSSTVPEAVLAPWHERGVPVTQVYGLTESGPTATAVPIAEGFSRSASAGKPVPHCESRVVDEDGADAAPGQRGEIWLRGPNIIDEYWRNPEATKDAFHEGWFKTGDVGHVDDDGWLYVDDRKKDVIISGSENVYPAELENVLADCPKIAEFAVIGRPNAKWGEVPVACVVLKDGQTMSADEVKALFDGRLARYKHPHEVAFMDGPLPRTSLGKVQKFELRERLSE